VISQITPPKTEPESTVPTPVFPSHFLGYRQFRITTNLELKSCGVNARWVPGKNTARCNGNDPLVERDHIAPVSNCACGMYAVHDPKYFSYNNSSELWISNVDVNNTVIAAAVQAWGPMDIHATGFRAKYAQVALLAYDMSEGPEIVELVNAVAKKYGVRAVDTTEFMEESVKFGDLVPDDQRPETDEAHIIKYFGNPQIPSFSANRENLRVEWPYPSWSEVISHEESEPRAEENFRALPQPVKRAREKKDRLNKARMEADAKRRKRVGGV
jgi:hypothetical protein